MKRIVRVLAPAGLVFFLLFPSPVVSQLGPPNRGIELMGTASGFKGVGYSPDEWRPAGTLRARYFPLRFLHMEVAYTYAATRTQPFSLSCSERPGEPISDPSTRWTGGFGFQAPEGMWRPFVGLGYGTFSGDPVWSWYLGLEYLPWDRFGLVAEYRAGEVNEFEDQWDRAHELGIGVAWRLM